MLRIMAEHADVVNFVPQPDPDSYADTMDRLERICEDMGRDFDSIRKTHFLTVVTGKDEAGVEERLERVAERDGMSVDVWRQKRSRAFVGTTAELRDWLSRYTELGVTQFMVVFPFQEEADSVKLFADEVIDRV